MRPTDRRIVIAVGYAKDLCLQYPRTGASPGWEKRQFPPGARRHVARCQSL